jgi:DNA-binding MarR family transcriptional regulator
MALLIALSGKADATQNDLVELTGIDKSTLKEMLGRMVAKGWIERDRANDDARAWAMNITEKGRALIRAKMAAIREVQSEILAPLPPEMRPVFVHCLQILLGLAPVDKLRAKIGKAHSDNGGANR